MIFRKIAGSIVVAVATAGCGHYGVSGPDDLGLAARFNAQTLPIAMNSTDPRDSRAKRNEILSSWIVKSDFLCADYQMQLSRSIRDSRLATDAVATVLSGLATIFAKPAMIHPLSGAATIVMGVGGDVQSDLFLQQSGDVMATAMQSVRTRARTKLEDKFSADYAQYTLEQGLVDVQRYDRETCNLNVAMNEIRALLNITGPLIPTANNPIIPLRSGPPAGSPESAPAGPVATAIITTPGTTTSTAGGGTVTTAPQVRVVNTPAAAVVTAPPSANPQASARAPGRTADTATSKTALLSRVSALTAEQALTVARSMVPKLPERSAEIQKNLRAIQPEPDHLTVVDAKKFIQTWLSMERDRALLNEWNGALAIAGQ